MDLEVFLLLWQEAFKQDIRKDRIYTHCCLLSVIRPSSLLLLLLLSLCCILLPLLFYMLSSNADTVRFLWRLCRSTSRCHTQPLGCLTAVLPPSFSTRVWRQAAGVLWLQDQRASERWSPSERGCVGGGEKVCTFFFPFPFSVPVFSLQKKRALSPPPVHNCTRIISLHVPYPYKTPPSPTWCGDSFFMKGVWEMFTVKPRRR